jgi:carbon-monoxide dehydrogenase iron sulfur subunit
MSKRLVLNAKLCTGCRYCEIVCSLRHEREVNPHRSRIKVTSDLLGGTDTPKVCHQCGKAPCISACTVGAIQMDTQLHIPLITPEKCTGCKACLPACPFGEIFFDEERNVAIKCDLCYGDPQCIRFCRALPHVGRAALTCITIPDSQRPTLAAG